MSVDEVGDQNVRDSPGGASVCATGISGATKTSHSRGARMGVNGYRSRMTRTGPAAQKRSGDLITSP